MFDFAAERQSAAAALSRFGFAEVIAEDRSTRPMRSSWYGGSWLERPVSATVIGTVVKSIAPVIGNRKKTYPCLQLTMEVALPEPIGCGLSLPLGRFAPASLAELVTADHPAARLPAGVLRTFLRLVQPDVQGTNFMTKRWGKRVRFTDRATLAGYYPPGLHSTARVLVIHDIGLDGAVTDDELRRGLDLAAWMAWSLETGQDLPG